MNEQVLALLKTVPKNDPLGSIVELVLLPELAATATIIVLATDSEFQNFESIYRRRYQSLSSRNIENYGILESIAGITAHSGKMKTVQIDTKNYEGYVWTDLHFKKLVGLVLVAKDN